MRLEVVYGSAYHEGKVDFIDELHKTMSIWSLWSGPTVVAGDFNLVRFASDFNLVVVDYYKHLFREEDRGHIKLGEIFCDQEI